MNLKLNVKITPVLKITLTTCMINLVFGCSQQKPVLLNTLTHIPPCPRVKQIHIVFK